MSEPVVEVRGLGKQYRLGKIGPTRLVDDVDRFWQRLRGREEPKQRTKVWALQDVSFSVQPGEVVGIIGRNGAGKSTLLKLLSRITSPTRGEIILRGRSASLLEIGTGFVGDLSGRENVYLNGAIMGMSRREIRSRMDAIVSFAEVEQYIDTPVKRYSSGMYVRLAFSVAAHLDPDILIVDEVLAVGDIHFQRKCLTRLGEASREGRTVLFVSHNMTAIQSLCTRGVMLDKGSVIADGSLATVVGRYLEEAGAKQNERYWDDPAEAPGNDLVRIRGVRIFDPENPGSDRFATTGEIRVETEFWILEGRRDHTLAYQVMNDEDIVVFTTGCGSAVREPGLYRATFTMPRHFLNLGGYSLKLWVSERGNPTHIEEGIAGFVIRASSEMMEHQHQAPGVVLGRFEWDFEYVGEPAGGSPSYSSAPSLGSGRLR